MRFSRNKQAVLDSSETARRNVVWSALDYVAVPLGMLVATPLLIHYLGLEQFGVFVLVTAFIGFSAVFNFGFGDTALKYVSHHIRLGNRQHLIDIVRTIGILALVSGIVIGVLFAIIVPLTTELFNLAALPYAVDTLYVTALIMPLKMTESVYVATLRGCHRYDIAGAVTVSTKLANIGLQAGLAIRGYDLPILLLATVGTVSVSNFLLFGLCCNRLGNLVPSFSRDAFREIKHFSVWSWMQGIAGLVFANIDRLIVTAMLGPVALGVYGVCIQLAQNIHYGLSAAAHSLFPRISMLNSARLHQLDNDVKQLRSLYLAVGRSLSVTAVLTGSLMAVFSYQILDLWVGSALAEKGHVLLSLLSISFGWFAANNIVTYYTLNGLGMARLQAGFSVTSAGIMALSSMIFIPAFGLVGAAVARFPDAIFRLGVRIYLGRSVIGNISDWVAFDFLRVTLIALMSGYFFREFLIRWSSTQNLLKNPVCLVFIVIFVVALFVVTYRIEGGFAVGWRKAAAVATNEAGK